MRHPDCIHTWVFFVVLNLARGGVSYGYMTPKRFLLAVSIIIILGALGGVAYYMKSHDTFLGGSSVTQGDELTEKDIAGFVKAVGKHMMLPEGEAPVAAKIVDIDELLKTQSFYRGAINGDILLIYQTAAKAIIYSPSRDLLVNVGPIILDENAAAAANAAPAETNTSDEESTSESAE